MSLSPDQEAIWQGQIAGLEDPKVDFEPLRLEVPDILERTIDLWYAIGASRDRLSDEELHRAIGFFANFLSSDNSDDLLRGLSYEEDGAGMTVVLCFPPNGVDHDQT